MRIECTCRSFPDRMCGCHLSFVQHQDCKCGCPEWSPTRPGTQRNTTWLRATWEQFAEDEPLEARRLAGDR